MQSTDAITTDLLAEQTTNFATNLGLDVQCTNDGTTLASLAIISDYPGETEIKKNKPLIGGSGTFLFEVLSKYNIRRMQVYSTNIIKRRVIDGTPVHKNELYGWQTLLHWELSQLPNLQTVFVIGSYALSAFVPNGSISQFRGSVLDHKLENGRQVKLVIANNPALILRDRQQEPIFKYDIATKLVPVINGTFKPHPITEYINPSFNEAIRWIDKMQDEKEPVATDVEVHSGALACLGFANSSHEGYCINFRDKSSNRYTIEEERKITRRIQKLFSDPNVRVVTQNGMYDSYWLMLQDRIRINRIWFDTMLAHHTLYPTQPHNLGFLTTKYTTHPYYKDEGQSWKEDADWEMFWRYNVKDCCITFAVHQRELEELRSQNMDHFFFNHVMRLMPHLVYMTTMGIKADLSLKEKITEQVERSLNEKLSKFIEATRKATDNPDYTINPNSAPQVSKLLFRDLRLVGRGTKTDATNRANMLKHPRTSEEAKEVLRSLNEYKKDAKFLGNYANMKIDEDGRIRCEYRQTGVQKAPGRLSSSQLLWGTGSNLQNQPEAAYPMYTADQGYAFTYFDLEQAEARVVGWKVPIESWIDQYEQARAGSGLDTHRALAAEMFNVPYEEVPTYDRDENGEISIRYKAKRCRHGLNYRMGPDRLAEVLGCSTNEAHMLYNLYHGSNPELRRWWKTLETIVRKDRMLYNAFGQRIVFLGHIDETMLESIVAFYPQSTVGCLVAKCIYQAHEHPRWPRLRNGTLRARCALNVHDCLITLHPDRNDFREQCTEVLKEVAEEPIHITGVLDNVTRELIIPTEFKYSSPDEQGVHRWSTIGKKKVAA